MKTSVPKFKKIHYIVTKISNNLSRIPNKNPLADMNFPKRLHDVLISFYKPIYGFFNPIISQENILKSIIKFYINDQIDARLH